MPKKLEPYELVVISGLTGLTLGLIVASGIIYSGERGSILIGFFIGVACGLIAAVGQGYLIWKRWL